MLFIASRHSARSAFTLVEVLVVAPVVLITIAIFIGIIINLTGEVLVNRNANQLAFETKDALRMIEQDVRISSGFLATNSITPLVSPQGLNNNTQNFINTTGGARPALILKNVALSGTEGPNRRPVWLNNQPSPCTAVNLNQNNVMTYNIIYFVRDNTLWRRTIMPPDYNSSGVGCSEPDQKPSCQPDQPGAICVARDIKVLENISDLSLTYFTPTHPDSPLAIATNAAQPLATRQSALNTANTVRVTVSTNKPVAGRDAVYSGTVRATRVGSIIE